MRLYSTFEWLTHYLGGRGRSCIPLWLMLLFLLFRVGPTYAEEDSASGQSATFPTAQATELPNADQLPSRIVFYWQVKNLLGQQVTLSGPQVLLGGAGRLQSYETVSTETGSKASGWSGLLRRARHLLPLPRGPVPVAERWCYTDAVTLQKAPAETPCTATLSLAPSQELFLPVVLEANEANTDTRSILRFTTDVTWEKDGQKLHKDLHAMAVTKIGYRELEALPTTLSLPSFLLIPGALLIIFFESFAKKDSSEGTLGKIIAKGPSTLVQAVSLSIVLLLFFYFFSGRNLLEGQSLVDILQIWVWTMLLGFLAGLAYRFRKFYQGRRLAENQPSSADLPSEALRKAIVNGSDFALYVPQLEIGATDLDSPPKEDSFRSWHASCWFQVARNEDDLWLAPVISVEPQQGKKTEKLIQKLIHLSSRLPFWRRLLRSDRTQLAQALVDGEQDGLVYLGWSDQRHPRKVKFSDPNWIRRDTDLRSFFEVEGSTSWRTP